VSNLKDRIKRLQAERHRTESPEQTIIRIHGGLPGEDEPRFATIGDQTFERRENETPEMFEARMLATGAPIITFGQAAADGPRR
jgi:hypothetical protein